MRKFLPSKEVALKRQKKCKPWLVGLIVGLFAPANLLFSYRQRKLDYAILYLIYIVIIYSIREFFPQGPSSLLNRTGITELFAWIIYSQYGPCFLYGFSSALIADHSKAGDRGWFPDVFKEKYAPSNSKIKLKESFSTKTNDDISKERLKELKGLFDQQLISEEEYEILRKKALDL